MLDVAAQEDLGTYLNRLFDMQDNPQAIREALSKITQSQLESAPDSVQFDYYYLSAAVDDMEDKHTPEKIKNLVMAKALCERSLGVHSPVYVELMWAIGNEYICNNDTLSALKYYRNSLVTSIGWYLSDGYQFEDLYNDMQDFTAECYQNKQITKAMALHKSDISPISHSSDLNLSEDDEFYITLNREPELLNSLLNAVELKDSGKLEECVEEYEHILDQWDCDLTTRATITGLLCKEYVNAGKYEEAEKAYLNIVEQLEQANLKNTRIYRKILSGLGNLYNGMFNYEEAQSYCHNAKYLFEENLDFGLGYIQCLSRCAIAANGLNKKFLSVLLMDVALDRGREILGQEEDDSEAMKRDKSDFLTTLLSNTAVMYDHLGLYEEALVLLRESIDESQKAGLNTCRYLYNLGSNCIFREEYSAGLTAFKEAYSYARNTDEKVECGIAYCWLDYLINSTYNTCEIVNISSYIADEVYSIFQFLSTDERTNFWKHFESYLPMLNLMLYDAGEEANYGTVYDNLLLAKGLLLRTSNRIKNAIYTSNNEENIKSYEKLLNLKKQLSAENDSLTIINLKSDIYKLDKSLTQNVSEYAQFCKGVGWRDVRDKLGSNDLAVEFCNIPIICRTDSLQSIYEEPRYCAVVLKKDMENPIIIPLFNESFLGNCESDELMDTDFLFNNIWLRFSCVLQGVENIYFAAEGELHRIGVEYALMPNGKRMNEAYNIYRLSSTRELVDATVNRPICNALLYGGLQYDIDEQSLVAKSRSYEAHRFTTSRAVEIDGLRYGVSYLPGTKAEVTSIDTLLQEAGVKSSLYMGEDGTEESFYMAASSQKYDILHLATHGFFWTHSDAGKKSYVSFLKNFTGTKLSEEDKSLRRSGLVFSGANLCLQGIKLPDDVEDGVLTAKELSDMNLGDVNLVVLSACQSGLGDAFGEGVFGLQRGFKLAGAKSLLMTLWKVDDKATQLLMTEFYRQLLNGKSKTESLRIAQQLVRSYAEYQDPQYWAGFILLDALN